MCDHKKILEKQTHLADNRTANIFVCHAFIGQGIRLLNAGNMNYSKTKDNIALLSVLGNMSVGMTCLAQGFELLFATVIESENATYNPTSQHDISGRFEFLLDSSTELKSNLKKIVSKVSETNPVQISKDQVARLEDNFFKARYFGVAKKRNNLDIADPKLVGAIAMSVASTYPKMLYPKQLAESIGYKVTER